MVGLQTFAENQKKSNVDGLQITSMRMASDAQAWLKTPIAFGGGTPAMGSQLTDFTSTAVTLQDLGYPVNGSGDYTDLYGTYSAAVSGADFVISATSAATSGGGDNNLVCTIVAGATLGDISTVINPTSGTCP